MTRKPWTVVPKGLGGEGGSSGKVLFVRGYMDAGFMRIHYATCLFLGGFCLMYNKYFLKIPKKFKQKLSEFLLYLLNMLANGDSSGVGAFCQVEPAAQG